MPIVPIVRHVQIPHGKERAGSAREVADALAAELDAQHPEIDWRATVAAMRS